MAEFSANLSAPQAAGAGVIAPVRQMDVGDVGGALINVAGNLATLFVANQVERENKQRADAAAQVVADFTREQNALADAVSQGTMTKAAAAARARATFSKYTTNYSGLTEEFSKINKSLFEHGDLGEAKEEEQSLQDMFRQERKDMLARGYVMPESASGRFTEAQIEAFRASRWADSQFERVVARNSEDRSQTAEERASFVFENKQRINTVVSELAGAHLRSSQELIRDARARIQSGEDPIAVQADIRMHFSNIQGALNAASALEPSISAGYRETFADLEKFAMDVSSGKLEEDAYNNQFKSIVNRSALVGLQDPQVRAFAATSKLLNGPLPSIFLEANMGAKRSILRIAETPLGATGVPTIVGDPEVEKPAFDLIKGQVKEVEKGTAVDMEGTKAQVSNLTNHVLKQVANATPETSATALNNAIGFIASPEYAKIVKYNLIDSETAEKAKEVFQLTYEQSITQAIQEKLSQPSRFDRDRQGRTIPAADAPKVSDLVDFVPTGAGIKVQAVGGIADRTDLAMQRAIQEELKPVVLSLNKLIHAGAHMEGHQDYSKYWEENKHNLLPDIFEAPAETEKPRAKTKPQAAAKTTQPTSGNPNWWEVL